MNFSESLHQAFSSQYNGSVKMQKFLQSTACNTAMGAILMVVGILITSVTMKQYTSHNKVFLVGPIVMTVGVLTLTKALMSYLKEKQAWRSRSHPRRGRHTRGAPRQSSQRRDSESAICLGPTDSEELTYEDDPPPYETVAHSQSSAPIAITSLPSLPPYDGGLVNPALEDGGDTPCLTTSLPMWTSEMAEGGDLQPPPPVYTPEPSPVHCLGPPGWQPARSPSPDPILFQWNLDPTTLPSWRTDAASPEPRQPPSYQRSRSPSPCTAASWLEASRPPPPRPPPPSYEEVLAMPARVQTTSAQSSSPAASVSAVTSTTSTTTETSLITVENSEITTQSPMAPDR